MSDGWPGRQPSFRGLGGHSGDRFSQSYATDHRERFSTPFSTDYGGGGGGDDSDWGRRPRSTRSGSSRGLYSDPPAREYGDPHYNGRYNVGGGGSGGFSDGLSGYGGLEDRGMGTRQTPRGAFHSDASPYSEKGEINSYVADHHRRRDGLQDPSYQSASSRMAAKHSMYSSSHGGGVGARDAGVNVVSGDGYSAAGVGAHEQPGPSSSRKKSSATQIEIAPGVHARLRGADETWMAVENDFYMPVMCFGCMVELCCIQDADYVLCPTCRVISPMDVEGAAKSKGGPGGGGGGVGLGFTFEDLSRWQGEIMLSRYRR